MQYQWKLKSLPLILICKQTCDTSNLFKSVNRFKYSNTQAQGNGEKNMKSHRTHKREKMKEKKQQKVRKNTK